MKRSNRYIVAGIGFIVMLFVGVFYAWSLFRLALLTFFPTWDASDAAMNFTIYIIFFCSGGLLGGKLAASWGKRMALRASALLILLGGLLFTSIQDFSASAALLMVYLSYGVICGVGSGMAYNVIISGVSERFPQNSGLVSGIMLTGFGFGSLFLGSLIDKSAAHWIFFDVFRVTVVLIALAVWCSSCCLHGKTLMVRSSNEDSSGYTPTQMLKTSAFWLYMTWVIFMNSTGLLVINSAASIAAYFGAVAALGMIVSLFNGFARIGIGTFFDRFGSRLSVAVNTCCSLIAGVLLLTAAITGSTLFMFVGLIIAGISYGSTMALNASVIKDLFGPKHFGSNFSIITLSGIPSSVLGPYISGILQDRAGGSYTTTFIAMCIFSLVALVLFFLLRRHLSAPLSRVGKINCN